LDFRTATDGEFDLPRLFANVLTGAGVANIPVVGIAPEPPKVDIYASYLSNIAGFDTTGGPAGNIIVSDSVILQSNTDVATLVFRPGTNDTAYLPLQPYDRSTKFTMSLSFDFTPSALLDSLLFESVFSIGGTNRFFSNANLEWQTLWLEVNKNSARIIIYNDRSFTTFGDSLAAFVNIDGNIDIGQTYHFQCDVFTADHMVSTPLNPPNQVTVTRFFVNGQMMPLLRNYNPASAKVYPFPEVRFGAGGGVFADQKASGGTVSNIVLYAREDSRPGFNFNEPLDAFANDSGNASFKTPAPLSTFVEGNTYTLGIQFTLQDEANSQGVIAMFGNPNGDFADGYESCLILRLEDAPDPIFEEEPKINPLFSSSTSIVANDDWPSAGWLVQAETTADSWFPGRALGSTGASSPAWIPLANTFPIWWQIKYPTPVRLTSFHLGTSTGTGLWSTRIPRDWSWQGSNDGST
jgi:hypothetical protein